jgi:hypothetical protein
MTIKDLYEKAKTKGMEHAQIVINYECDDDWYSVCQTVHMNDIEFKHKDQEIFINIE